MAEGQTVSDAELIELADEHLKEDRLLQAARALRRVEDQSVLSEKQQWALSKAAEVETIVEDLGVEPGPEWSKHGENHGRFDTIVYYKVVESRLTARLETPIDPELLVPLISVLNETELYTTWLPRWEMPIKLGVRNVTKLREEGRCNQRMKAVTDLPWPVLPRECLIDTVAVDDIDENGVIVVRMMTPSPDQKDVPSEPEEGCVRIDFEGGFLFRKCPKDHPAFLKSKNKNNKDDNPDKDLLLCNIKVFVDGKVKFVPLSLVNFVTRTVLGRMWGQTLAIAEDVRVGKREQHAAIIEQRREEVYDWVAERCHVMLRGFDKGNDNDEKADTQEAEQPKDPAPKNADDDDTKETTTKPGDATDLGEEAAQKTGS